MGAVRRLEGELEAGPAPKLPELAVGVAAALDDAQRGAPAGEVHRGQLLGGGTARPHAVAITELSTNHVDWHGCEDSYRAAKEEILGSTFPNSPGPAVLPAGSAFFDDWSQRAGAVGRTVVPFAGDRIPPGGVGVRDSLLVDARDREQVINDVADFPLKGRAQLGNLACATALALALGASKRGICDGMRGFRPVPHRQQTVAEVNEVRFVNDSKATTPRAAVCALEAFGPDVVLLAGGSSKGGSFEELAESAASHSRHAILYGATAPSIKTDTRVRSTCEAETVTAVPAGIHAGNWIADDLARFARDALLPEASRTQEPGGVLMIW